MASLKRIMRDYKDIIDHPYADDTITVEPVNSNYYKWQGTIIGADNTVYEGGIFFLNIEFPTDYPFKPPTVKFTTKVYHPNVEPAGGICLATLKEHWSPNVSVRQVLDELNALLYSPDTETALRADVATQYKNDLPAYEKTAKEWTAKYAQ